jgi:hypothetical protein
MRSASSASTRRPVSRISAAFDEPTARGSKYDTPNSLPVRPLVIPAFAKYAASLAKRMSAPSVMHMPPPIAAPLIAAITGCGSIRSAGTTPPM